MALNSPKPRYTLFEDLDEIEISPNSESLEKHLNKSMDGVEKKQNDASVMQSQPISQSVEKNDNLVVPSTSSSSLSVKESDEIIVPNSTTAIAQGIEKIEKCNNFVIPSTHVVASTDQNKQNDSLTIPRSSSPQNAGENVITVEIQLDNEIATEMNLANESHLLTELERRELENKKKNLANKGGGAYKKKKWKLKTAINSLKVSKNDEIPPEEECKFVWEEYLEETASIAAFSSSFLHVEKSLENGFKESMMIQVMYDPQLCHFWFATIVMTCGPLLSLRYLGYDKDSSKDFWCDINSQEVHPLGWCEENNLIIIPPSDIIEKYKSWQETLLCKVEKATTPPSSVFENGITAIDQIKQGMKLEVEDSLKPSQLWFATVIENVGGRLRLRYHGFFSESHDFWLFYLSSQLHPIGWAKSDGLTYCPPQDRPPNFIEEPADKIISSILDVELPSKNLFKETNLVEKHNFKVGLKIEFLSPVNYLNIVPATITHILDDYYFIVEIDDFSDKKCSTKYCRHNGSWDIFYPDWAKEHGLKVQTPRELNVSPTITGHFSWDDYLKKTNSKATDRDSFVGIIKENLHDAEFVKGMQLEAVNPFEPHQLCAASITKVVHHLLWIKFDSVDAFNDHHITTLSAHHIFPVGWCESNNYPLKSPRRWLSKRQRKIMSNKSDNELDICEGRDKIEKNLIIHINHRCFSGRFLCKSKIAQLPKSLGPGSAKLVLKEVVSLLISAAYNPIRVLKELEVENCESHPSKGMIHRVIKAKYKKRIAKGILAIPQHTDNIEEFCRSVCKKLECCSYLFGRLLVGYECPNLCFNLKKTQFTSNVEYVNKKAKRLGRPPKALIAERKRLSDLDSDNSVDLDGLKSKSCDEPALKMKKLSPVKGNDEPSSSCHVLDITLSDLIDIPKLASNPANWTVHQVIDYFHNSDCDWFVSRIKEEEIDGLAILLLNLPLVRQYFGLKIGPAMKVCKHIERLKTAFCTQYAQITNLK